MIKRILILTMALAICLTVCSVASATGTSIAYVKTGDGGPVNVRSYPSREAEAIGKVAYGESVLVDWSYAGNDGWTRVVWGSYGDGYIMSRFLVGEKPAPYNPQPQPQPQPAEEETDIRAYSSVKMLNTIVQNARFVEPYNITVTPTRASGWVYLRWFPSRDAKELATYGDGKTLRVISELKDWYQVEDPDTGKTGFLYKSYVNK